jgi:hypothetical protein
MEYNTLFLTFCLVGLVFGVLNCVEEYGCRGFSWFFGFHLTCCVILVVACLFRIALIVYG